MSRDAHSCTHWLRPRNSPSLPPHLDSYCEGAIGQQRQTTSLCNPLSHSFGSDEYLIILKRLYYFRHSYFSMQKLIRDLISLADAFGMYFLTYLRGWDAGWVPRVLRPRTPRTCPWLSRGHLHVLHIVIPFQTQGTLSRVNLRLYIREICICHSALS